MSDLGKTFLKAHGDVVLPGRKVALCSCSIHITKELKETKPGICVLDATVSRCAEKMSGGKASLLHVACHVACLELPGAFAAACERYGYALVAYRYSHAKKHIVYQCPTFTGDCGSALVMYDGKVLGLHVEGVNQLKERIVQAKSTNER